MKAITIQSWGLNPPLVMGSYDEPKLSSTDVLVQVHASSVNPKDWKLNYSIARAMTPIGVRLALGAAGGINGLARLAKRQGKSRQQGVDYRRIGRRGHVCCAGGQGHGLPHHGCV
ncbi:MAG TPA: hypothetical protein VGE55_00680 [Limnobacter sp.]|uniref:hypothetical protein n=1 Tax=Limnobacter sp. TaxID=2003368 RepID=UPI002EDB2BC3